VAVSSDAPYGDACPWTTVAAAARRESDGVVVGPDERVDPAVALASMLTDPADPGGPPRTVQVGAAADLCLLSSDLKTALENAVAGRPPVVRLTLVGGRATHLAPSG